MNKDQFENIIKLFRQTYIRKYSFVDDEEYNKDIRRVYTVKKQAIGYLNKTKINYPLMINNVIISLNVFGSTFVYGVKELCTDNEWQIIKTFLVWMDIYQIDLDDVDIHQNIMNDLNQLVS